MLKRIKKVLGRLTKPATKVEFEYNYLTNEYVIVTYTLGDDNEYHITNTEASSGN